MATMWGRGPFLASTCHHHPCPNSILQSAGGMWKTSYWPVGKLAWERISFAPPLTYWSHGNKDLFEWPFRFRNCFGSTTRERSIFWSFPTLLDTATVILLIIEEKPKPKKMMTCSRVMKNRCLRIILKKLNLLSPHQHCPYFCKTTFFLHCLLSAAVFPSIKGCKQQISGSSGLVCLHTFTAFLKKKWIFILLNE